MTDEDDTMPVRPLKNRDQTQTPKILAMLRHVRTELAGLVKSEPDEDERQKYVRATAFVSRALGEIE